MKPLTIFETKGKMWGVRKNKNHYVSDFPCYISYFHKVELAVDWVEGRFPSVEYSIKLFKARKVKKLDFCRIYPSRGDLRWETNDCTVIAFCQVTGISYAKAHPMFKEKGRPDKKGCWPNTVIGDSRKTVAGHTFTKVQTSIERGMKRLTLNEFLKRNPIGTFYVTNRNHAFAVYDGMVFDIRNRTGREKLSDAWEVKKLDNHE